MIVFLDFQKVDIWSSLDFFWIILWSMISLFLNEVFSLNVSLIFSSFGHCLIFFVYALYFFCSHVFFIPHKPIQSVHEFLEDLTENHRKLRISIHWIHPE